MKNLKNKKGITLIALIITIIVLLILAGITINLTIGQNGIMNMAQQAGKNYIEAEQVEKSELHNIWQAIEENIKDDELVKPEILENIDEFEQEIKDEEKLRYIINKPEIFMDKILKSMELSESLFKSDEAIDLIIESDTWRNAILESSKDKTGQDSIPIKALDNSNPINLPITGLELYNKGTKTGNVHYSSYLRNKSIHSPINAFKGGEPGKSDWESDSLPAYIGYDFGEGNEVWIYKAYVKGGNNTTPTKMYLQSSQDNINYNTVYEFTRYTTANNYVTEVINSNLNNTRARYWRLYITESQSGQYIDLLKIDFYGK